MLASILILVTQTIDRSSNRTASGRRDKTNVSLLKDS
jgi:hypothetical protein